jgi:hypothetical protein
LDFGREEVLGCEWMLCLTKYEIPFTKQHHTIQTQTATEEKVLFITDSKAFAQVYREKVKVKVTLVQTLRLCTGRRAQRGSRGIALLYRH